MKKTNQKFRLINRLAIVLAFVMNFNFINSIDQECIENFEKNNPIDSIDTFKFTSKVDKFFFSFDFLLVSNPPFLYLLKDEIANSLKRPNFILKDCKRTSPHEKKILVELDYVSRQFLICDHYLDLETRKNVSDCYMFSIIYSESLSFDDQSKFRFNLQIDLKSCTLYKGYYNPVTSFHLLCEPSDEQNSLISTLKFEKETKKFTFFRYEENPDRRIMLSIDKNYLIESQIKIIDTFFHRIDVYDFMYILKIEKKGQNLKTKLARFCLPYFLKARVEPNFESYTEVELSCQNENGEKYNNAQSLYLSDPNIPNLSDYTDPILYVSFSKYDEHLKMVDKSKGTILCSFENEQINYFFNETIKKCFAGDKRSVNLMKQIYLDGYHNEDNKCIKSDFDDEYICSRKNDRNSFIESKISLKGQFIHRFKEEIVTSLLVINDTDFLDDKKRNPMVYTGTNGGILNQFNLLSVNKTFHLQKNDSFKLIMNESINPHRFATQSFPIFQTWFKKNEFLISNKFLIGHYFEKKEGIDSECKSKFSFKHDAQFDLFDFPSKANRFLFIDDYLIILSSKYIYLLKNQNENSFKSQDNSHLVDCLVLKDSDKSILTPSEISPVKQFFFCYPSGPNENWGSECFLFYLENDKLNQKIRFFSAFITNLKRAITLPSEIDKFLFINNLDEARNESNSLLFSFISYDKKTPNFLPYINSSVYLNLNESTDFKIEFIFAFDHDHYDDDSETNRFFYLVKREQKTGHNITTKIVRVCYKNNLLSGYVELNLKCKDGEIEYSYAQTAILSSDQKQLYVSFSRYDEQMVNDSKGSILCSFDYEGLQSIFNEGIKKCYLGETKDVSIINYLSDKAFESTSEERTSFCTKSDNDHPYCSTSNENRYIEYRISPESSVLSKFENETITSMASRNLNGKEVIILMSSKRHVYKLIDQTLISTNLSQQLKGDLNESKLFLTNDYIYAFYDRFLIKISYDLESSDESLNPLAYYLPPLIICIFIVLIIGSIKMHSKYYVNKNEFENLENGLSQSFEETKMKFIEQTIDALTKNGILIQKNLEIEEIIGEGCFGLIYKGKLQRKDHVEEVAIKTFKDFYIKPDSNEFIEACRNQIDEALIMKDFQHVNVMRLIGVFLVESKLPFMIVLPFMRKGNLLNFLRDESNYLTIKNLLKFAIDVSEGMVYLSSKKFVHRDLAGRNCMLDENPNGDLIVKVGDFGLSKNIYQKDYYTSAKKDFLPFRWMSIEMIEKGIATIESDIWSYGILLWEIFTRGSIPYTSLENNEILDFIKKGNRLPMPENCPSEIYLLALDCWQVDTLMRPLFTEISHRIQTFLREKESKLDIYARYLVNYLDYPYKEYYAKKRVDKQTRIFLKELPFFQNNKSQKLMDIPDE